MESFSNFTLHGSLNQPTTANRISDSNIPVSAHLGSFRTLCTDKTRTKIRLALVTLLLLAPLAKAQTVLNATLAGRGNNIFVITVSLDDGEKNFLLDTGSALSTFDRKGFRNHLAAAGKVVDTTGFGRTVPLELTKVDFTLGAKHIKQDAFRSDLSELSTACDMRIDGVIGQDILSLFDEITFNYRRHVVVFK